MLPAIFLSGCASPSLLIKTDDSIFNDSQLRLTRMQKLTKETKAPPAEEALFLQAESLYEYRFEPPPRGSMAFLAEAAAAITDFPAFQSLAGSLSLADMRLRATDSAVQLWETLLLRYPESSLRPLTLYRLGWAYRSTSAPGLPRQKPNEAFDELIQKYPASALAGFAKEAELIPSKSKYTAATRSALPGLGQIYVGETKSGVIRMSIAFAALTAIVVPIYVASHRDRDLQFRNDWPLLATGLAGLITLSYDFTSSYEDSMRGVVEWNERAESEFNRKHPSAP